MQITVKGRHIEVGGQDRDYALLKLGKLEKRLSDPANKLEVELYVERNDHIAEGTLWAKGKTLRAKEKGAGFKEALDLMAKDLERQVQRYRDKREPRERAHIAKRHEPTWLARESNLSG